MKHAKILFSLGFFLILISSCKDDVVGPPDEIIVDQLKITVQPTFNGSNLYLDSVYTTSEGYDVKFTELKFFAEDIKGNTQIHNAALFNYRDNGTLLFQVDGKPSDATTLTANLGVGVVNHNDPSAFPVSSVLNISNSGDMHWSWNPGYIFMKVEGKVDTIADGNPLFDHNVVFHIGKDINLQTMSFPNPNWLEVTTMVHQYSLQLDMSTFLQNAGQNIDLKAEFSSHTAAGQEVLSLKVIENFNAALKEL